METINIFMPTYYREQVVQRCVNNVVTTMRPPSECNEYEVNLIIVDNDSGKDLKDYLRNFSGRFDDVKFIQCYENVGKTRAINAATHAYPNFDWFINCDSDMEFQSEGWPIELVDLYKNIDNMGLLAPFTRENQMLMDGDDEEKIETVHDSDGSEFTLHYDGPFGGMCFLTEAELWWKVGGYSSPGVYGHVDQSLRIPIKQEYERKTGYIDELTGNHFGPRCEDEGYKKWKIGVNRNLAGDWREADPNEAGNAEGYYD